MSDPAGLTITTRAIAVKNHILVESRCANDRAKFPGVAHRGRMLSGTRQSGPPPWCIDASARDHHH